MLSKDRKMIAREEIIDAIDELLVRKLSDKNTTHDVKVELILQRNRIAKFIGFDEINQHDIPKKNNLKS